MLIAQSKRLELKIIDPVDKKKGIQAMQRYINNHTLRTAAYILAIIALAMPGILDAETFFVPDSSATIQQAIDSATDGDTVLVAQGTYSGNLNKDIDFHGKSILLMSEKGSEMTVIDCEGDGRGFYFHSGEQAAATLQGFTVINGYETKGSGICCFDSEPTIIDCVVSDGVAQDDGGGMYFSNSKSLVSESKVTGNRALDDGGGIFSANSNLSISSCEITGNTTTYDGGGVYFEEGMPEISNSIISENHAKDDGGGFCCDRSSPAILNCLITSNLANDGGGGIVIINTTALITNSNFILNTAGKQGGAVHSLVYSLAIMTNCILWEDTALDGPEIYLGSDGAVDVTYSDIQGGWDGEGNISEDPSFLDYENSDYRLSFSSPCNGAGTTSGAPKFDLEEGSRPNPDGSNPDIGAYESIYGEPLVFVGAIASWRFDELFWTGAHEEVADSSGNGYHGTAYGDAFTDEGQVCRTGSFDGAGDYIQVDESSAFDLSDFTYSAWVNVTDSDGWRTIIDVDNDEQFLGVQDGEYTIYGRCGAYYHGSVTPGWHHLVWIVSGSDYLLYEDGVVIGSGDRCSAGVDGDHLMIGAGYGDTEFFNGYIDEVAIFDYAISDEAVQTIYANQSSGLNDDGTSRICLEEPYGGPVWHIAPLGSDDTGDGSVENPFASIQTGIDSAADYDTVLVADGTYTGDGNRNMDYYGKPIVVISVNGPESTIIDCENDGRGFYFHNEEEADSRLEGFTITNGKAAGFFPLDCGGGIHLRYSSSTITNCIISGNTADWYGGGIFCHVLANPVITGCTLTGNSALTGGGGITFDSCSPSIINCSIIDNSSNGDFGCGGGIYGYNASPTISGCTVSGGSATGSGGGFYWSSSSPEISDCTIVNNIAAWDGGGMMLSFSSCNPEITRCTISGNIAGSEGGGIGNWNYSAPEISNCTISGNNAMMGGGMSCGRMANSTLTNCLVIDNSAVLGGGIYIEGSTSEMTQCTFTKNIAEIGGALYALETTPLIEVSNSILYGNSAADGPAISLGSGGVVDVVFSNIEYGWPGEGNINADPQFFGDGDYRLTQFSRCIDSGKNSGILDDIQGEARPSGNGFDMGSDEYYIGLSAFVEDYPECIELEEIIEFTAGVENLGFDEGGFDSAVLLVSGPASTSRNLYNGPVFRIDSGASVSTEIALYVPRNAPLGFYTFTIEISYQNSPLTSASFVLEITDNCD